MRRPRSILAIALFFWAIVQAACGDAPAAPPVKAPTPAVSATTVAIASAAPSSAPPALLPPPPIDLESVTDVKGAVAEPEHAPALCTVTGDGHGGSLMLAPSQSVAPFGRVTQIDSLRVEVLSKDTFFAHAHTASGTVSGYARQLSLMPTRPLQLGPGLVAGASSRLEIVDATKGSLTVSSGVPRWTPKTVPSAGLPCEDAAPRVGSPRFTEDMERAARQALAPAPPIRVAYLARKGATHVSDEERGAAVGTIEDSYEDAVQVLEEHGARTRIAWTSGTFVVVGWVASSDVKRAKAPAPPPSAQERLVLDMLSSGQTSLSSLQGAAASGSPPPPIRQAPEERIAVRENRVSEDDPSAWSCPVAVRAFTRDPGTNGAYRLIGQLAPGTFRVESEEPDMLRIASRPGLALLKIYVARTDLTRCTPQAR